MTLITCDWSILHFRAMWSDAQNFSWTVWSQLLWQKEKVPRWTCEDVWTSTHLLSISESFLRFTVCDNRSQLPRLLMLTKHRYHEFPTTLYNWLINILSNWDQLLSEILQTKTKTLYWTPQTFKFYSSTIVMLKRKRDSFILAHYRSSVDVSFNKWSL